MHLAFSLLHDVRGVGVSNFLLFCENHIIALLVVRHVYLQMAATSAFLRVGYCYDGRPEFVLASRRMLVLKEQ